MVLVKRILCLICMLGALVVAGCSTVSRQQVVAVDSHSVGSGSPTKGDIDHPVPPVVSKLLVQIEQDLLDHRYSQAERALRQAQRLSVNEPRVYFYWGQWAEQQGMRHQAEQMYRRALSLTNTNSELQRRSQRALDALNLSNK